MGISFDSVGFASNYRVRVGVDYAPDGNEAVLKIPPGHASTIGASFELVTSVGRRWRVDMGPVSDSDRYLSGLFATPHEGRLLVVASGECCFIDCGETVGISSVDIVPILRVHAFPPSRLVLEGGWRVACYGREGLEWVTPSDRYDELRLVREHQGQILGEGWRPPKGAWEAFSVDLASGVFAVEAGLSLYRRQRLLYWLSWAGFIVGGAVGTLWPSVGMAIFFAISGGAWILSLFGSCPKCGTPTNIRVVTALGRKWTLGTSGLPPPKACARCGADLTRPRKEVA